MTADRLRSIVPMFGGGTNYVETLDATLEFVESHTPTTDELVGWYRGTFDRVSSRTSIMRRVSYLRRVGFINLDGERWRLGEAGREYARDYDLETLLRIMCTRNVGLRSLLYELAAGPMSIEAISEQQLNTHAELGWSPGETDMALQRTNWLRSMGLVEKRSNGYALTDAGHEFVDGAVADWTEIAWTPESADDSMIADTYETTVQARVVDQEFRDAALARYDEKCPVSGVDHAGLLDVAHILSWSEYPSYRADLKNVLPLSKTHHAAFDRELFTIDQEFRLRVNPTFDTESNMLQQTIINKAGERVPVSEETLDSEYLARHNASLKWMSHA